VPAARHRRQPGRAYRGAERRPGELLRTDGPWPQAAAAQAAAAAAAERLGDQPGQAHALTELGNLQGLNGDYPGAEASLRAALELHRETSDKAGTLTP